MKISQYTLYRNYKLILSVGLILVLLFSTAITVCAAPFINAPNQIAIFFSNDLINDGKSKYQDVTHFEDTNFGIALNLSSASFGFRTTLDSNNAYTFYEIFANWETDRKLIFEITLDRLNDDGSVFRFGACRELPFDSENFHAYLEPGISMFNTPTTDEFGFSSYNTSLSLFLQAKANYHFSENLFIYGNGMYDFNLNTSIYELGLGFTY